MKQTDEYGVESIIEEGDVYTIDYARQPQIVYDKLKRREMLGQKSKILFEKYKKEGVPEEVAKKYKKGWSLGKIASSEVGLVVHGEIYKAPKFRLEIESE